MAVAEARRVFLPDQQWLEGSHFPGLKEGSRLCPCVGFDYSSLVSSTELKMG